MIKQVSVAVATQLEGAAQLSQRAQRFIENQGPRVSWGELWGEVSLAKERLEEVTLFEAELDQKYSEHSINPFAILETIENDHPIERMWAEIRKFAENTAASLTESADAVMISLDRSLDRQAKAADVLEDQSPVAEKLLATVEHRVEHRNVTFKYYLTFEETGLVSFNVEASEPVSMRLKSNGKVIRPDDDEFSLQLALYQESDLQDIEHYVGDDLVWSFHSSS
jgi:hypothetical protein